MYRAIPTSSKLLSKRWQEKERKMHLDKLKNMTGTLDRAAPKQPSHLKNKVTRQHILEGKLRDLTVSERYTEIERENRILLEKMTNILQKNRGSLFSAN